MIALENYFVKENFTLKEVLKKLDETGMGIVCVVDEQKRLLGIATDGDVRRAIYNLTNLDENIMKIANKNPITVNIKEYESKIYENKIDKNIRHLIIIDDENHVIKIEFSEYKKVSSAVKRINNPVVLMVGGLGNRLRPLTEEVPKPMLKVSDKPILEIILNQFKKYGFYKFYFCVNYKKEKIMDYFKDGRTFGVEIKYIIEDEPLGTMGAVSLIDDIEEDFIVMNGDILTNLNFVDLLRKHKETHSDITIACREYSYEVPFGVITYSGERVINFEEKPYKTEYVNAGIYAVNKLELKYLPYNSYYDITDLITDAILKNRKVNIFPVTSYWRDIGRIDDYKKANLEYSAIFK